MQAFGRIIAPGRYNHYFATQDSTEPIFTMVCTVPDDTYRMREMSDETHIPLKTLYTWCDRMKEEPTWRPSALRFQANPGIMDDDIETMMAQYLLDNFVSLGKDLSIYTLKRTLLMLTQSYAASGTLPESALIFKCYTTYMRRFLKRNGLTFRRARPSRQPNLDES
jgi:hypothetical protein